MSRVFTYKLNINKKALNRILQMRMQRVSALSWDGCDDYFASCCNCCNEGYPCCEFSPGSGWLIFEDLDNAHNGYPVTGHTPDAYQAGGGSDNSNIWLMEIEDTWGGDGCSGDPIEELTGYSSAWIEVSCIDDRYWINLPCGRRDVWVCGPDATITSDPMSDPEDHPRGRFMVEATEVTCCPFKVVFEFIADVPLGYCWPASTGNHFRITLVPNPYDDPPWGCCCPDRTDFPTTLYARITGRDGCECMSQDFTLTGAGGTSHTYSGSHESCDGSGADWEVTIDCGSNGWTYSQSACRVGSGTDYMELLSCDPFNATVTIQKQFGSAGYCCAGYLDIEISETPF